MSHHPIILVIHQHNPLQKLVLHTVEHWCPTALVLEAHTFREAWPPLHRFTLTAVICEEQLPDGQPAEVLALARARNAHVAMFFVTANRTIAAQGFPGATDTILLPAGVQALVVALRQLR